jgi:hypothetical protein
MATYDELLLAAEDPGLNKRVRVACVIAADSICNELATVTNHVNRMLWAKSVFQNPQTEAQRMLWAVLAQNKAASLAAIIGANDATVQTAVNTAVDRFATGVA